MPKAEWEKKTVSLDYLRAKATEYDDEYYWTEYGDVTMVTFLRWCHVIPIDVKWKRKNAQPRTELDALAIPAGYLAEVAYEWDQDGPSRAGEFIDSLEFEISGTARNHLLNETMAELGRDIV